MSAIAGASVRFLEKTAALESLVEKLTSSNQQLVIIAEHIVRRDVHITIRRGECKPTFKHGNKHQRRKIKANDATWG